MEVEETNAMAPRNEACTPIDIGTPCGNLSVGYLIVPLRATGPQPERTESLHEGEGSQAVFVVATTCPPSSKRWSHRNARWLPGAGRGPVTAPRFHLAGPRIDSRGA